jgi:HSP20 family protein
MPEVKEKKMAKSSERPLHVSASRALSPFEEMDRMFDAMFGGHRHSLLRPLGVQWPSWGAELPTLIEGRVPRVDVVDRDHEIIVKAELPGVKKEDLDVTVGNNSITIRAKSSYESKEEKGDYYCCEISRGEFSRTVGLPSTVDAEKAKAKFADGVLEMTLPKMDGAKRRTVKID